MNDLSKEVYKDTISPAFCEIGKVAGRSVKALLAPIRGLLWCWEQFEAYVEAELQKRLDKIPEEQVMSPDPIIAVPLIQSLTYTAQNNTLREMYIALLANSMDKRKEQVVHPSYVDIIRKMNTLDARVFEAISGRVGYTMAINPSIHILGKNEFVANALPEWYLGWTLDCGNEYDISASLVRLKTFGLIDLLKGSAIYDTDYSLLEATPFLKEKLSFHQRLRPRERLILDTNKSSIIVNEYGQQFRQACQ